MHSKEKGNLGELKVASDLVGRGYPVFRELGDNSKVDLIALVDDKCIKVQVKAINSKNGTVSTDTRKSGPNYRFRYTEKQVDIFAIYVPNRDVIFYITSKEFLIAKGKSTFRIDPAKGRGNSPSKYVENYLDFPYGSVA